MASPIPKKGVYPTLRDDGTKWCSKCKAWVPLVNFPKRGDGKGCGYSSSCRPCIKLFLKDLNRGRDYQKQWKNKHPMKRITINMNSNAKRRGLIETVSWEDLEKRFWEVGGIYYICNHCIPYEYASYDHVRPIIKGGQNNMGNLLPTHRGCNAMKMGHTVEEILNWRSA